jgi:hypothetical protein
MIISVTDHSYVKATTALLKPGEELSIDFKRLQLAYNIVNVEFSVRDSGFVIEFTSEADAVLFLLRFS